MNFTQYIKESFGKPYWRKSEWVDGVYLKSFGSDMVTVFNIKTSDISYLKGSIASQEHGSSMETVDQQPIDTAYWKLKKKPKLQSNDDSSIDDGFGNKIDIFGNPIS